MKKMFALIPLAATAVVLTMSSALAAPSYEPAGRYAEPYGYARTPYPNYSDPSNTSAGYNQARRLGRCVEDLGYGRYEYCD